MLEIEVLHAAKGDKKKDFDTSNEPGRQQAAVFINKMMKQGVAIFLERGKKSYRVKSYDPKKDLLTVALEEKAKTVTTRGKKAKTTAVAPVAGGV